MRVLKDNRANKTYSSRFTRWVDRFLPFQFKVVHAAGRTMGMADYLSRHPSQSISNEQKIKAEELWNNGFTVNEITKCKIVSEEPSQQNTTAQPIKSNKLASENEMQESVKESNEAESTNVNEQTLKDVVATIKPAVSSDSGQETDDKDKMSEHIFEAANQPPLKVPQCYSFNQIALIQTLGNNTFASQYDTDEFLQKVIN